MKYRTSVHSYVQHINIDISIKLFNFKVQKFVRDIIDPVRSYLAVLIFNLYIL
jgi:hypothetical protein